MTFRRLDGLGRFRHLTADFSCPRQEPNTMKVGFKVEVSGNGEPPRVGAAHPVGAMADYNARPRGVSFAEDAVYQGDEILGVNGENWDTVDLLMSETREAERLSWMSSTSFCSLRRASFTC